MLLYSISGVPFHWSVFDLPFGLFIHLFIILFFLCSFWSLHSSLS